VPSPHQCRQYADLCDRFAQESSDDKEKAILRQIAGQWRRLANLNARKWKQHEETKAKG
jgi:hypothetical protein